MHSLTRRYPSELSMNYGNSLADFLIGIHIQVGEMLVEFSMYVAFYEKSSCQACDFNEVN